MRRRAIVLAVAALTGLGPLAWAGGLQDLGTFGPSCPLEAASPSAPPGARLVLRERPPEDLRVTTRLTFAPGVRHQRVLRGGAASPAGAPATLAFIGTDGASLELVRALPPGSLVYLVAMRHWQDVRTVQGLCPRCLVGPGSDALAELFGVTRYPALVQWTGRELVVTEGP